MADTTTLGGGDQGDAGRTPPRGGHQTGHGNGPTTAQEAQEWWGQGPLHGGSYEQNVNSTGTGTTGGGTGPTAPGSGTSDQNDAYAYIQTVLNQYGLGGLASWAWQEIIGGKDSDQVVLDLYQTPQFKARFPAIAARQASGLPAISPADYISYENSATQIMREAGLPAGFWDSPSDFTKLIADDVSTDELQQRVNLAQQAMYQSPPSTLAVLQRDYGISGGGITAAFLDPDTALPLLQQQFLASQIGGAADLTGYGSNKGMDDQLAQLGVTQAGAQQGFTDLAGKMPLFTALPGEKAAPISQQDQLAAEFEGNAASQLEITRRSEARAAAFQGGGGFNSSTTGFTGVGQSGAQ